MGSMSYCRFKNTLGDLGACLDDLQGHGSIADKMAYASEYEAPCVKALVALCVEIAGEFGPELACMGDSNESA